MCTADDFIELVDIVERNLLDKPDEWDASSWVTTWLDTYVPALACTPHEMLDQDGGKEHVIKVLNSMFSGTYQ